jgi:hypothetical protein
MKKYRILLAETTIDASNSRIYDLSPRATGANPGQLQKWHICHCRNKKTSPLSELVRINTTVNFLICFGADRPDPLHQRGLLGAQMGIQREATAEGRDPTTAIAGHAVIFGIEQAIGNDIGDFGEFCRAHTARGHGR